MAAEDIIKTGSIADTMAALTAQIRKDPSDPKLRIFIFQMYCIQGAWDKALTQLKVCGELDPGTLSMVQAYREAIACEMMREKVFAGKKAPLVFGKPENWIALLIQALEPAARGDGAAAAKLREQAFEEAPTISGTANGVAFEWLADADSRIGPVFEMILNGKYYWVPQSAIKRIQIEEPSDLRDRVWTPVNIILSNGGETVAFIPTRYPGAPQSDSDDVKMARVTDWQDIGGDTFIGAGQRLFATDTGDLPLMDLRDIILDVPMQTPEDETAEGQDG
jgi:type VI secretion system protein ImpE